MKAKYSSRYRNGMVSLVVTLFIMLIVSLVALSFAAIMRREQRQALDRQLSAQAFYAAETGVNDAIEAVKKGITIPANTNITSCDDADQDRISSDIERVLDASAGIGYTCVFIDQSPMELHYDITKDKLTIIPLNSTATINRINIGWEDSSGSTVYPPAWSSTSTSFTDTTGWLAGWPAVLRTQLIPNTYPATNIDINNNTLDFLAYPSNGGSSDSFDRATTSNGHVLNGACVSAAPDCSVSITNLDRARYVLTLRGIYDDAKVTIKAYDLLGVQIPLTGAQIVVDSTGKAGDIARRIKVYAPVNGTQSLPAYVLEVGDDICKRLLTNSSTTHTTTLLATDPDCNPGSD